MNGPFERDGLRWWLADGVEPEGFFALAASAAKALEAGAEPFKAGRRKHAWRLALRGPAEDHLWKVNHYPAGKRAPRVSKARRELARAEAVAARGVATPVPLAAGEEIRDGKLVSCRLAVALLPGVQDLRARLDAAPEAPATRREMATAFGAFACALHEAGIHQDDFQPNNFLVRHGAGGTPEFLAIDFERTRIVRFRRSVPRRLRLRALAKLDRETHALPASLRHRFLLGYAGGDVGEARQLASEIAEAAAVLARRDRARLERIAVPGRRYIAWGKGLARKGQETALEPGGAAEEVFLAGTEEASALATFASALTLAARGLAPRPVGVSWEGPRARLYFAPAPGGAAPPDDAALRVLEHKLARYGRLAHPPSADDVSFEQSSGRTVARLRNVERWEVRPRFGGRGGSAGRPRSGR